MSVTLFYADKKGGAGAVMPHGGTFSAVGGFSFFSGNDFGGGGKTKTWQ